MHLNTQKSDHHSKNHRNFLISQYKTDKTDPAKASSKKYSRLIVTFFDHGIAEKIIAAKKRFGVLMKSDIMNAPPLDQDVQVYVNLLLPQDLYELRKFAKTHAKYVWFSGGRLLLRFTDGGKVHTINKQDDVMQLLRSQKPHLNTPTNLGEMVSNSHARSLDNSIPPVHTSVQFINPEPTIPQDHINLAQRHGHTVEQVSGDIQRKRLQDYKHDFVISHYTDFVQFLT